MANLEFHRAGEAVDEVGAAIVAELEAHGIRAVNPSMGFPMEMCQLGGGATWVVSHKPVAVEAGLGHMGIHRNLIHPKFGNFVLLGTVLMDCEAGDYDQPIEYNPCLECKLCVAACPVGAIGPDGSFNFSSCFTHNYRDFSATGRGNDTAARSLGNGSCLPASTIPGSWRRLSWRSFRSSS